MNKPKEEEEVSCNEEQVQAESSVYNLEPVASPRVVGYLLLIFPKILRLPLIGDFILKLLKKNNKFDNLYSFASTLTNLPLYYPLHNMRAEEQKSHEEMIRNSPLSLDELQTAFITADAGAEHHRKQDEENKSFFRHWSISDFTSRYKKGEITPTQVAKRIINIVKETKDKNPLIIMLNEEDLLKQAEASTKRYEQKAPKGVLDGVPIAVKDEIPVVGYPVARGTSFMRDRVDEDCSSVTRLKNQGGMIVGKTNQHEMGLGTTGYNKCYGIPRNPYNTNHFTGGSSSGSAAAVAAGIVPLALGTDGGGSIRIPSALCGVFGVKPTFKRESIDFELAPSVESIGPIAGTLNDAALAYAIIAGPSSNDFRNQSLLQPKVHLHNYINPPKLLHDIRIGYFKSHVQDSEPSTLRATIKAIEYYKSLGAEIVEIELPHLQEIHLAHALTISVEIYTYLKPYYESGFGPGPNHKNNFTGEVQCTLELAKSFSSSEFLAAQKVRAYAMEYIEDLFEHKMDVLLSPATAMIAPKIEKDVLSYGESNLKQTTALMKYVVLGNLTGIPGIVFPIEYDDDGGGGGGETTGLPISILLQSSHWREDLLFRLAQVGSEGLLPNGLKKPTAYIGGGLTSC